VIFLLRFIFVIERLMRLLLLLRILISFIFLIKEIDKVDICN